METDSNWLRAVQPGDTVFVWLSGSRRPAFPVKVARVTATLIVINNCPSLGTSAIHRFKKSNGYMITLNKYCRVWLCQPTQELHDRYELFTAQAKVRELMQEPFTSPSMAKIGKLTRILKSLQQPVDLHTRGK